jgi:hypothetical protein
MVPFIISRSGPGNPETLSAFFPWFWPNQNNADLAVLFWRIRLNFFCTRWLHNPLLKSQDSFSDGAVGIECLLIHSSTVFSTHCSHDSSRVNQRASGFGLRGFCLFQHRVDSQPWRFHASCTDFVFDDSFGCWLWWKRYRQHCTVSNRLR